MSEIFNLFHFSPPSAVGVLPTAGVINFCVLLISLFESKDSCAIITSALTTQLDAFGKQSKVAARRSINQFHKLASIGDCVMTDPITNNNAVTFYMEFRLLSEKINDREKSKVF